MAEHVQAALDQMVAPLLDLQERSIFTSDEIHTILTRRRESEYALRRRHARKSDFVEYLQHEISLEQLRALRTKRLYPRGRQPQPGPDLGADGTAAEKSHNTKHPGDIHIRQHLHLLWTRTLRKFGSDVALWLQYAQFCREYKSHRKLGAVYAQALQLHPRVTGLWIEAADWEWQQGRVSAARVLLQRGLRLNTTSTELWLQSFALELHSVQQLAARRKILHGNATTDAESTKQERNDKKDRDEDVVGEPDDGVDAKAAGGANREPTSGDPYPLARLVFDHACQAIPDQVGFHAAFLQQCRFFPNTTFLERHILQRIRQQNGTTTADAWMAQVLWMREHVRRQQQPDEAPVGGGGGAAAGFLQSSSRDAAEEVIEAHAPKRARCEDAETMEAIRDPVLQLLREATLTLQTEDMYLNAVRFLFQYRHDDDESEDSESNAETDECAALLQILWKEAQKLNLVTSRLVLEYVSYLENGVNDDDTVTAERILKEFICSKRESIPASVWVQLASLQSASLGGSAALTTLETGLCRTPVHDVDHLTLLLQLVGLQLEVNASLDDLWPLLERLLLLYPGFAGKSDLSDPPFGIRNVPHACLEILRRGYQLQGLEGARKIYEKLFFQSGFTKTVAAEDTSDLVLLVNEAVNVESKCALVAERKRRLLRLFDFALSHVPSKTAVEQYRKSRDELMYDRVSSRLDGSLFTNANPQVATFDMSSKNVAPQDILAAYNVFQVVHLRNVTFPRTTDQLSWKSIGALFAELDEQDQDSWCIETTTEEAVTPTTFLAPSFLNQTRAYCSFLVQKDRMALQSTLEKVPLLGFEWAKWAYEPALWVFFGRNPCGPEMQGRPEHTDSVSHDGTWHFQLSGRKRWVLRPSLEMLNHLAQRLPHRLMQSWQEDCLLEVDCKEGDVMIINTKLWFHQTRIPPQRIPSVSYARDFRFKPHSTVAPNSSGGMTNVDGIYATSPIEEGTIVFTENDMPNAELHRSSSNPNCRVVVLDDGSSAVVSARAIGSGEFFCIPPSDESQGDSDESGDEGSGSE